MPIGRPSQRPEPKSACTPSSSPIERTMASESGATGSASTRWFVEKSAGNRGQPARAALRRTAGSMPYWIGRLAVAREPGQRIGSGTLAAHALSSRRQDGAAWRAVAVAARALRDALGTSALRRLQAAWTASSVGGWALFVALSIYAYDVGGASAVGLAAAVRMVPAALAAPATSMLGDRYSRRNVLLALALLRAAVLAAAAALVWSDGPAAAVFALGAAFTAIGTGHKPAQAALLPALADDPRQLAASNAVWSAV